VRCCRPFTLVTPSPCHLFTPSPCHSRCLRRVSFVKWEPIHQAAKPRRHKDLAFCHTRILARHPFTRLGSCLAVCLAGRWRMNEWAARRMQQNKANRTVNVVRWRRETSPVHQHVRGVPAALRRGGRGMGFVPMAASRANHGPFAAAETASPHRIPLRVSGCALSSGPTGATSFIGASGHVAERHEAPGSIRLNRIAGAHTVGDKATRRNGDGWFSVWSGG
jgi:hypothetical protein